MVLGIVRFIAFCETRSSLTLTLNRISWAIARKLIGRAALWQRSCYSGFDGHGHRVWICSSDYRHGFGVRAMWIHQRSDGRGPAVALRRRRLIIGLRHRLGAARLGDREVIGARSAAQIDDGLRLARRHCVFICELL